MAFGAPWRERQHRVEPVEGLNCSLLVHTEHRCVLRRLQVKTDNVGGFLLELRIVAGHVAVQPMRLQFRLRPNPLHGRTAQPGGLRHLAARPVRVPVARFALGFAQQPGLHSRRCLLRLASFVLGFQAAHSVLVETRLPALRSSGAKTLPRMNAIEPSSIVSTR